MESSISDAWQDFDDGKKGYSRVTELKKNYPHLKVTLAIGGWNEASEKYSRLVANPSNRKKFVAHVSTFIRKHNFDGLDLDWEYPTQRGGVPDDRKNFVTFVQELHSEFEKHKLILTSAFGASQKIVNEAYDVANLAKLFDYMHIMCYDYGGSWDRKVGWNSPLTDSTQLNVKLSIEHFLTLGAPASKLVLGVPFYGRTFVAQGAGYYADPTDDKGFQGPYTRENGFMGYNEICEARKNSSWLSAWDEQSSQAILRLPVPVNGTTNVVTYDSTRSIANKMRYVVQQKLAGAMIWSIDTDDFRGICDLEDDTYKDFKTPMGIVLQIPKRVKSKYPLLTTVNEALMVSLDELQQEEERQKNEDKENEIPHGSDMPGASIGLQSVIGSVVLCIFSNFIVNLLSLLTNV